MATILFQAAGAAIGSVFGPVGAIFGRAAGALAGSALDHALINGRQTISGPRLSTARYPGADEGTAINRLYGTARIAGTLIWATRFEEQVSVERGGSKASGPSVKTFNYFANFAIGLCQGEIACIRRVWADGKVIDLSGIEMRVYRGDEAQLPDPLIEAKQGEGNTPAYRGLAYVVFERLPLDPYGNRIPLLQFEVLRPVGQFESDIRAVTIIPGATEHGYATTVVTEKTGAGSARAINRNTRIAVTDWQASLDELTALCPNLESVALVISWFGTDLRAGECRILPGVEVSARQSESAPWSVAGLSRAEAHLISASNGGPAFGGTPDDISVKQAIADLKARGLKVFLYPFLMMDIPENSGLADPYGWYQQPAYPWRGRITCHPATGRPESADKTAAAHTQISTFADNPDGYRRLVLHYADLAVHAGGVDGLILGSELRGLTSVRDETNAFPFVDVLKTLAADVRAIVGPTTKLTYGADWSEYFGYHPADGSGDVYFNLDPLWASTDIDAVGIDNYMPLADWRDDDLNAVNPDGFRVPDDLNAMQAAITSGEGFEWYYASEAARRNRIRSPITDGLANKPWTFRFKDIEGWWSNTHHERIGGMEQAAATAWQPKAKPIWFTELGCPAVDKGANQPNVFPDPKSVESALPYFSSGARSDGMQRRFLEAHHKYWNGGDAPAGMVDPSKIFLWTWDARPYPAFPLDTTIWSDGNNWRTGHWLNGRLGAGTLADVIAAILRDQNFTDFDVSDVSGDLVGYVQADVTSARSLIEPLLDAFQIDVIEDAGILRFRSRAIASLPAHMLGTLADIDGRPLWQEVRGHDSDFAAEAVVSFYDPNSDYEQASTRSRRASAISNRILQYNPGAILAEETAAASAEMLLRDNRLARLSIKFALSPTDIALQPGDVVAFDADAIPDAPEGRFLVTRIEDGRERQVEARQFAAQSGASNFSAQPSRQGAAGAVSAVFAPIVLLMDLPQYEDGDAASFARAAIYARPWRNVVLSASVTTEGYQARATVSQPARIGTLVADVTAGTTGGVIDNSQTIIIDLPYGSLSSAPEASVRNGVNRFAMLAQNGVWEIGAFLNTEEIAANRWRLSSLLRGLAGTGDAASAGSAAGSTFVLLDDAVVRMNVTGRERGLSLNWIAEPAGTVGHAGPFGFAGGIRAETPVAPVALAGHRSGDGISFTWARRNRTDADAGSGPAIPLDEPFERYRIEILSGSGSSLRSAETTVPSWLYPTAAELADFGTAQPSLAIRVRQLGQTIVDGVPATATISL